MQPARARDPQLRLEPLCVLPRLQGQKGEHARRWRTCSPTWTRWPRPPTVLEAEGVAAAAPRPGARRRRIRSSSFGVTVLVTCSCRTPIPAPFRRTSSRRRSTGSASVSRRSVRVTTYARAATLARRTPAQLERLAEAGLTRVHLGLESGADEVLMAVDKGCSGGDLMAAGEKVVAGRPGAVLLPDARPGRARGRALPMSRARPACCARSRRPHHCERPLVVRLRTAAVVPGTPLAEREAAGEFEPARRRRGRARAARPARSARRRAARAAFRPRAQPAAGPRGFAARRSRTPGARCSTSSWPCRGRSRRCYAVGARLGIYGALDDRLDARRRAALAARIAGYGAPVADELLAAASALRARFL